MSLRVSASPHLITKTDTQSIMRDVVIALAPAALAGVWFFGYNALAILLVSTATAVLSEFLWQKLMKKPVTISDMSAAVTGLLVGMSLPPTAPLWLPLVGSFLAIVLVKQLFGGLGGNFMNPALAARGILLAAWPVRMTAYSAPSGFGPTDITTTATELVGPKAGTMDLLMGNIPGSIGEVCKIAILVGFAYLLIRKVISWQIPVVFMATTALCAWAFGTSGGFTFDGDPLRALLTGGVMLGAVFMATDYTTSPMAFKGQVVYAIGCGLLVMLIRTYGSYPEGLTYAVLVMNIVTPLIDKYMRPRVYGVAKKSKEVPANG